MTARSYKPEQRCSHGPKIRFRSQAKARQAMLKHRHSPAKLHVYKCPNCDGWHITSQPKQPKGGQS